MEGDHDEADGHGGNNGDHADVDVGFFVSHAADGQQGDDRAVMRQAVQAAAG